MCGCSSCATVRASRTNRTASDGEGVRHRSMPLTATSRFNGCSRTRNTAANPPSPSRSPTVNSFPRACCRRRRSVTVSSDMTDAKPRNARRLALGIVGAALVWLLGVWPPPVWWRDHRPRETAMMRERRPEGWNGGRLERPNRPTVQPTALKDISPLLQRMVIIGEDSRFRTHHGIDPAEIGDALGLGRRKDAWGTIVAAWRQRDALRGASTITQQLAKNLYLSSSRNPLRKLKEAITALRLELALSKDRILELYLSMAQWGPGLWGVDAASRAYFGVPPSRLDEAQAAALAATLPHPLTSTPTFRPDRTLARRDLILARYHGGDGYIPPEEEDTVLLVPPVISPPIASLTVPLRVQADTAHDTATAPKDTSQTRQGERPTDT